MRTVGLGRPRRERIGFVEVKTVDSAHGGRMKTLRSDKVSHPATWRVSQDLEVVLYVYPGGVLD